MPREPQLASPTAFLQAVRNESEDLRQKYLDDPEGLMDLLGLRLPRKPLQVMRDLGLYDEDVHGPIYPGLRELVIEVCSGEVESAAAVGPRGGGKALSLSTPLPTPDGWTTMGEVRVGDEVFAADGSPITVMWKSGVLRESTFDVVFDDGTVITCGGNHEWITSNARERMNHWWPQRRTTRQIYETLHNPAEKRGKSPNHVIDNCATLRLPEADLPIDPYVLGVWLGDGGKGSPLVSVGQADAAEMQVLLKEAGYEAVPVSNSRLSVRGLSKQLRELGVFDHKHIPNQYMRASVEQRLALIQGLMDTDGTTRSTNNNCQFSQKDDDLVFQFAELVASMGWKYTTSLKTARCQTGASYKHFLCSFNPDQQVYRLSRKAARLDFGVGQRVRITRRYIVDVAPVEEEDLQCIQVAHSSHLYLAGEAMVPTHNSQGVSFIEFFLVFIKMYDALNLGGSELQADQVYKYLLQYIESDPQWLEMVDGDTKQSMTETIHKAWIRVLTASQKSVRSPHAGGRKRMPNGTTRYAGGLLVIDEEAEAEADIVEAALPTINTARPSVNVRCSTFHNAEGSFADLIDNHVDMGYKLYRWDIFDIVERCECGPDGCESEEACFREDHVENVVDPNTGEVTEQLVHRAYCGGRSRYAEGWLPIKEAEKLWKRMKRSHSRWEVEAMGSRPTTANHVIKDHIRFAENITAEPAGSLYLPGGPVTICVDWGTGTAGINVWQEQALGKNVLLLAEELTEAGQSTIFARILELYDYYPECDEVAADIGGGGNYLNKSLREEYGVNVRDVNFQTEKEAAVAAMNMMNEAHQIVIPEEFTEYTTQIKRWKRKNGRIDKGNDHMCDASVCHFSKFIEQLGLSGVRVPPKTFSTVPPTHLPVSETSVDISSESRVALAVGVGRRRR